MDLKELATRRNFDLRVLSSMRCPTFDFEAYRTIPALNARRGQVADLEDTSVSKYRFILRVRTHIGPRSFSEQTEIGVDTDVPGYPRKPPLTWIISKDVPWSPHFMAGAPVCIGQEFWGPAKGYITLGHLAIHLCHLLNWDEKGRGHGYVGWNAEAIRHHRDFYNNRPINPGVPYPVLPKWLSGPDEGLQQPGFEVTAQPVVRPPGFEVI